MRRGVIFSVLVTLAVFGVYFQAGSHSFLDFDDRSYVVENPAVAGGLTEDAVIRAFSFSEQHYWHPVTTLSHALDVSLFGMNPGVQHLMNVLFHVYAVLLFFWVLFLMTGRFGPSAFAAALFAFHPLNVEAVAWIAERKTVLSTFFALAALLSYFRYARRRDWAAYAGALACFGLALLSKPAVAVFPFVLLLLDYWPLGRTGNAAEGGAPSIEGPAATGLLTEKIPFFLLSVVVIIVVSSSMEPFRNLPGTESLQLRLANAAVSVPRYLEKLVWPDNLAVFYPFPRSVPAWQALAALLFVAAVTAAVIRYARRAPYLVVGWLWFLGALVPVLGVKQGGLWPAWADRFAYFPALGLFIALSFGVDDLARRRGMDRSVTTAAAVIVSACLALVTFIQVGFWKDDFSLFSRAAAVTAENNVALTNLGNAYATKGDYPKALDLFKRAVAANPSDAIALRNMADIFMKKGDPKTAEDYYKKSLALYPADPRTHKKYARLLAETGRRDEAFREMETALSIRPDDAEAELNMGLLYLEKDDTQKAASHFERALALRPDYTMAAAGLKRARGLAKLFEAVESVKKAIAEKGETPKALNLLGALYLQAGKTDLALPPLLKAVSQDPANAEAWNNLATARLQKRDFPQADAAATKALALDPSLVAAYYNKACLASLQKRSGEAASWLAKAVDKGFDKWQLLALDPDMANARQNPAVQRLIEAHSNPAAAVTP